MANRGHGESRAATSGRCGGTDAADRSDAMRLNLKAAPALAVLASVMLASGAARAAPR